MGKNYFFTGLKQHWNESELILYWMDQMTVESTLSPQYGGKNVLLYILKYIEARRKSIPFLFLLFISRFEVLPAAFMKSSVF
jgi:hypothetical protein